MKGGRVLSFAGSDPGGGAGIQADVKTVTVLGGFGMSVVTALTVQNTLGVREIFEIPPDFIARQFDALAEDIGIDAIKTGMLPNRRIVELAAEKIKEWGGLKVVVDPVLTAKGGMALMDGEALAALTDKLLPLAEVITPNVPEAEALSGIVIATPGDVKKAAVIIRNLGAENVVIKGGHLPGSAGECLDILYDGSDFYEFKAVRIDTRDTHGTGCAFSAAIAACLAHGRSVPEAVAEAKEYVTAAIAHAWRLGKGHGPVNHLAPLFEDREFIKGKKKITGRVFNPTGG